MVSVGQEFREVLAGQCVFGVTYAMAVTCQPGLQSSEGFTEVGGPNVAD